MHCEILLSKCGEFSDMSSVIDEPAIFKSNNDIRNHWRLPLHKWNEHWYHYSSLHTINNESVFALF